MFSVIKTAVKQIKGKSRDVLLAKQHYSRLYNFHIIIEGNITNLPTLLIKSRGQEANIDIDFYANLDFKPNIGFELTYYNTIEQKLIFSYKSYGAPDDISVTVINNDTNQISTYMIIEADVIGGGVFR